MDITELIKGLNRHFDFLSREDLLRQYSCIYSTCIPLFKHKFTIFSKKVRPVSGELEF